MPTALLLAAVAAVSLPAPQDADGALPPDELYGAWEALPEERRRDAVDWFAAECDRSDQFRFQLERFVLDHYEGERFEHPAAGPTPVFDAAKHCPAQVIERRFVDPESPKFERPYGHLATGKVTFEFEPAYRYDWGRGEVVSTGVAWDDPARVARNASRGFGPKTDLVEALVTARLDDAPMEKHAYAFARAYSDRDGNAFEDITLYDAWSSGASLEMPDVEVLGIVHTLEDDWDTYVAPVPPSQHSRLYKGIANHFKPYSRYRGLREALARTYLQARPNLPKAYKRAGERLHGYWEESGSDPAQRITDLPDAETWSDWLEAKSGGTDRDPELVGRRRGRMQALEASDAWARRTFEGILRELGAFEAEAPGDGEGGGGFAARRDVGGGGR